MSEDEIRKEPGEVRTYDIRFHSTDPLYCERCQEALVAYPIKTRIEGATDRMWIGCPTCGVGFRIFYTNSQPRSLEDFDRCPFPKTERKTRRRHRRPHDEPEDMA